MARSKAMSSKGTLYGVGVGPGDPELMTVKAWRLIANAKTIAYLTANGTESTARSIAAAFIDPDTDEITIDMPMRVEREAGRAAYDLGAKRIAAELDKGGDVIMLCEGDPFFYGSFMYLFERLADDYKTVVVPGITSITASAAVIGQPLCERNEVLKVLPATMSEADLNRELSTSTSAAIIKVGRHFGKVKKVLIALNLDRYATIIERATQAEQIISNLSEVNVDILPYFTTIIVRRKL